MYIGLIHSECIGLIIDFIIHMWVEKVLCPHFDF